MVNRSIYILIFLCFFGFAQARAATQIITLKSKVFDNERSLRILLPEGYDREREEPYPVLYMNDGQNLYSAEDSMTGQEWQMDEILPSLIKNGNLEQSLKK